MYLSYFIKKYFYNNPDTKVAELYYKRIVAMARNVKLYEKGGVSDTLEGRYELIVLHSHLFIRRLIKSGTIGKSISQEIIDILVKDFDYSLRELGIGDLSVGKKIKKMLEGYYGRAEAYEKALSDGPKSLVSALKKNLYGSIKPSNLEIEYIRNYISNLRDELDIKSDSELSGEFPDINF